MREWKALEAAGLAPTSQALHCGDSFKAKRTEGAMCEYTVGICLGQLFRALQSLQLSHDMYASHSLKRDLLGATAVNWMAALVDESIDEAPS